MKVTATRRLISLLRNILKQKLARFALSSCLVRKVHSPSISCIDNHGGDTPVKNLLVGLLVPVLGLMIQSPVLAQSTPGGPNGPIYNCSNGCTIVTCNATTCTVNYCNTSGCTVVGTYPRPKTIEN